MMGSLILNSLDILRFRDFRHLQIERLSRVNLIVGKNNVGKSNLLEALQLYEGFQKAAQEDSQSEGLLIRLESKKDQIVATLFDERSLGIATREQIEVR